MRCTETFTPKNDVTHRYLARTNIAKFKRANFKQNRAIHRAQMTQVATYTLRKSGVFACTSTISIALRRVVYLHMWKTEAV